MSWSGGSSFTVCASSTGFGKRRIESVINTKSRNVANRANGKMRAAEVYLAARCCLAEAAGASLAGVICSIDLPLT